jgi:hypothetical protein
MDASIARPRADVRRENAARLRAMRPPVGPAVTRVRRRRRCAARTRLETLLAGIGENARAHRATLARPEAIDARVSPPSSFRLSDRSLSPP